MDSRRMCPQCRAFITSKDKICPYCNEPVGARAIDRRNPSPILGGLIPHARFLTVMISTINAGMFLITVLYSMRAGNGSALMDLDGRTLVMFGAKFGPAIQLGQWWRLVTAGYLHGGLFHIFMNSWVLLDVGAQVEEIYGAGRMFVFYTAATICGFYLSYLWMPMTPSMGASAGIMGLIGVMIAWGTTHRSAVGDAVRGQYIRWVIYMLIIGLLPGFNVDNAAHVGGLASGFGIAYLAGTQRYEGSPVEKLWKVAAGACILLTAACFLEMYLSFSQFAQ
jgi:rhomboid protease GluP